MFGMHLGPTTKTKVKVIYRDCVRSSMLVQLDHLPIVLFNRISPEEDSAQHEDKMNLHACKKNKEEHFPLPTFRLTTRTSSCNLDFRRSPLGIIFREVNDIEVPKALVIQLRCLHIESIEAKFALDTFLMGQKELSPL